jgi:hypothetical protein
MGGQRAVATSAALALAVLGSLCVTALPARAAAGTTAATAATADTRGTGASVLSTYVGVPGVAGTSAQGSAPSTTHLEQPAGLAVDPAGDLYIADPAAHVVDELRDGRAYTVAGIPGVRAAGADSGGPATGTPLDAPTGLLVLPDGTLLIADPAAHVVWALSGGSLSLFAGTGAAGRATDGAPADTTTFLAPTGLAADPSGTVYLSDAADDTVWSVADGVARLLAGRSGEAGYGGDNGAGTVLLNDPTGLAWDGNHLLVADTGNHRVRSVTPGGLSGTAAGPLGLSQPVGLLVDPSGAAWVADSGTGRVLSLAGGTPTSVVGTGTNQLSPDGTLASTASLDRPTALARVSAGRLLVAEAGGAVVRSVGPPLTAPARPAAPTVTVGDGRATVAWSAPNDGGSPVVDYLLREYTGPIPGDPLTIVGSQSIIVQGLTDGLPYAFTITAVNAVGTSPESPPSAPVVPTAAGGATTTGGSAGGGLPGGPGDAGGMTSTPGTPVSATPTASADPTAAPAAAFDGFVATNSGAAAADAGVSDGVRSLVTPSPTALPRAAAAGTSGDAHRPQALPATAPPIGASPSPSLSATALATPPAALVPVHSFADAATDVATVGRKTAIPLVLVGLLVAFLLLQGVVDRRDPKLVNAPVNAESGLEFGLA